MSIIEIEINSQNLKGVQCNSCKEILWIYQDASKELEALKDQVESLDSRVDDLE